ncbi:MAG: peptide chain release factor 1 [Bacteriovoracaceae bacterium]|nr:peptide chain release factor 1 [Bacteriovoracaceae bacterium]
MSMFDKLDAVVDRFATLEEKMADPSLYDRQDEFKAISEERANLVDVVGAYQEYKKVKSDIDGAKDILRTEKDEDLRDMAKEELNELEKEIPAMEENLTMLLLPKDPLDNKNIMVEIRAAAGGDEASIFVADVFRMYSNFLKSLSYKIDIISISEGDEGIKEIIFSVSGEKPYSLMKYESGVHRVQRVPKTESQGRIHTSTITVAVMPEADEVEFELDMNDVRVDVYRSGGCGGQSVNTTDSAVRVTHNPTGTVVAIQDEKSQHKNKEKALKILTARIYDKMVQAAHDEEAAKRSGQIGKGDRSERIRTYNFPQGRLSDHRIGLTLYSLDKIIEGDMAPVTDALIAYNQAQLLKGHDED